MILAIISGAIVCAVSLVLASVYAIEGIKAFIGEHNYIQTPAEMNGLLTAMATYIYLTLMTIGIITILLAVNFYKNDKVKAYLLFIVLLPFALAVFVANAVRSGAAYNLLINFIVIFAVNIITAIFIIVYMVKNKSKNADTTALPKNETSTSTKK